MKIQKAELAQKLSEIKGVVTKKNSNPVLQGVLVKDGYLIANNMEMTVKTKIIDEVIAERNRQDEKLGEQNHSAYVWADIIGEEYGEMCKAINEFDSNPTLEKEQEIFAEAIQTMASCMAMLECMESHLLKQKEGNG